MRPITLLLLCCMLSACAQRAPLPEPLPNLELPVQLHVQQPEQDALLVIQQEGAALRFSLFDPMGVPLARQQLHAQHWSNDGLLPPNPQARELFAALLFALTPLEQLPSHYGMRATPQSRQGPNPNRPRWHVLYQNAETFELHIQQGLHYRIRPLTETVP